MSPSPGGGRVETYLVYHVDKSLGVVPAEISDHSNFMMVREDGCDQRDALACGEGMVDQPFPCWLFTAHQGVARLSDL